MSQRMRRFEHRAEVSGLGRAVPPASEREELISAAHDELFGRPNTPGYALERICPEGVRTSLEAITDLYIAVNGHSVELAGNRDPHQFREMLRAIRPITNDDLGRLDHQAPQEMCTFYRPHLRALAKSDPQAFAALLTEAATWVGKTVENLPASPAQLVESFARSVKEAGDVGAAIAEASKDGKYSDAELQVIAREAQESAEASRRVQAAAVAMLQKPEPEGR